MCDFQLLSTPNGSVGAEPRELVTRRYFLDSFAFRLEREDGTPADPPTLKAAVPDWRAGDTIALGPGRMLRVVGIRIEEGSDGDPVSVLVVEETWPQRPLAT
jgi:hypothetical protein